MVEVGTGRLAAFAGIYPLDAMAGRSRENLWGRTVLFLAGLGDELMVQDLDYVSNEQHAVAAAELAVRLEFVRAAWHQSAVPPGQ